MAQGSSRSPEVLRSEERWDRWARTGQEDDARAGKRGKAVLALIGLVVGAAVVLKLLIG